MFLILRTTIIQTELTASKVEVMKSFVYASVAVKALEDEFTKGPYLPGEELYDDSLGEDDYVCQVADQGLETMLVAFDQGDVQIIFTILKVRC